MYRLDQRSRQLWHDLQAFAPDIEALGARMMQHTNTDVVAFGATLLAVLHAAQRGEFVLLAVKFAQWLRAVENVRTRAAVAVAAGLVADNLREMGLYVDVDLERL